MKRDFNDGLDFAKELDKNDELKDFRRRFYINQNEIYMDGNSLGLASKDAIKLIEEVQNIWKDYAIRMFDDSLQNGKYFLYHKFLGAKQAKLINAKEDEVTIMTNTTINIHQAIATLYKPTKEKYKILVDDLNFATDWYAVDSQVKLHGFEIEDAVKIVKSRDGRMINEDDIIAAMSDDVALVHLPSLLYRSAQLVDMEKVTKAAHEKGIIIGWDLCHSIGAVPHDFSKYKPDYAVWCNYKYISAGPGAPAGFYLNERHFDKEVGLAGWHGSDKSLQ
ncbi:MAG: aminotransferase class V-fold PLP-dependent enzyme, partial [Erysipelotrichales bacterium]